VSPAVDVAGAAVASRTKAISTVRCMTSPLCLEWFEDDGVEAWGPAVGPTLNGPAQRVR
jgi:hypothetical protein